MAHDTEHEYSRTVRNLSTYEPYFAARREDAIRYIRTQIQINIVEAYESNTKLLALANTCLALEGFSKYVKQYKERAEDERGTIDAWFYSYYIKSGFFITSKTTLEQAVSMHYGRQGLMVYQTLIAVGYEVMTHAFWIEFEQMIGSTKPAVVSIELPVLEMM